jgi:copper(I)-binding protein
MTRAALLLGCVLIASAGSAFAEDYSIGSLQIGNPWTRATPKGAAVAGAYLTISNKGNAPDRLIGGSSPVADRFEVHNMVMDGGVAKMRPVQGGLEVKPGETVELKPGGLHVMLTGLKEPLVAGQKIKGTLEFEKAGKIEVEFPVEAIGGKPPMQGMQHH